MAWSKTATKKLIELYGNGESIGSLAVEFGVNTTSIINKLVREKVYVKPKKPETVTKKKLARQLQELTGLDLVSSEKMDKKDFILLVEYLKYKRDTGEFIPD